MCVCEIGRFLACDCFVLQNEGDSQTEREEERMIKTTDRPLTTCVHKQNMQKTEIINIKITGIRR